MTATSQPRILQIGRLPLPALETELAARYSVACLADQADPQGFLAAHGAEFSGVVTTASIGLTGEVIAALPHLQDIYGWLAQKNLVAIASLYSAQVLHHIALSCMSPIHPGHIQGFNSHQEAIAWLDAQYDSD